MTALLAQYQLKVKESSTPGKGTGLDQPAEEQKPKETEQAPGKEMEKVDERPQQTLSSTSWKLLGVAIAALFLVILGYRLRRFPKGKSRSTGETAE